MKDTDVPSVAVEPWKNRLHFVSGLPRSGSTLLMNLLGQNPRHYVTPTSGLVDLLTGVQSQWTRNVSFMSQGLDVVKPRIASALAGMVHGFYRDELDEGKLVWEKSRGWLANIELLELLLDRRVPIVTTVRDIKSVVASFEKLYRKAPLERHPFVGPAYYAAQTVEGRARVLLHQESVLGLSVNRLRDALARGVADRLLIVPYNTLVTQPVETLNSVHSALGLEPFVYDPNNVEQITQEDDTLHGWGSSLHVVRRQVFPPAQPPWIGVLPIHVCRWLDEEFADINAVARGAQ